MICFLIFVLYLLTTFEGAIISHRVFISNENENVSLTPLGIGEIGKTLTKRIIHDFGQYCEKQHIELNMALIDKIIDHPVKGLELIYSYFSSVDQKTIEDFSKFDDQISDNIKLILESLRKLIILGNDIAEIPTCKNNIYTDSTGFFCNCVSKGLLEFMNLCGLIVKEKLLKHGNYSEKLDLFTNTASTMIQGFCVFRATPQLH